MFTKAADNNLPFQEIIPSKWKFNKGPLMLTHIDPLMHLIFYGVGSSTIEELQKFLMKRESHAKFKKIANYLLPKVIKLKLSWCKLLNYKEGTFGGWIAENWIAFLRITKWISARVPDIAKNVNYVEPKKKLKIGIKKS